MFCHRRKIPVGMQQGVIVFYAVGADDEILRFPYCFSGASKGSIIFRDFYRQVRV